MSKIAKARIAYTGKALENGEMDVKELAPALIAFADLVESASVAIGHNQKIRVMLNQDSIQKGSFDITFILDTGILEQAKLIVGWADDTGFSDLMEILGWSIMAVATGGIFALVKKVRGRTITGIEHKENNRVEITVDGTDIIVTDEKMLKVFLNVNCRVNVEKVVRPLNHEGIECFELRDPEKEDVTEPILSISKGELPHFKAPPAMPLSDETSEPLPEQEILVKIITVNFDKGKWRFTDGTNIFWASMCDENFNSKIESREVAFASGDMLKIRYHIQQSIKSGNLSSEYIVTKVLELRKQPQQIQLDFEYNVNNE